MESKSSEWVQKMERAQAKDMAQIKRFQDIKVIKYISLAQNLNIDLWPGKIKAFTREHKQSCPHQYRRQSTKPLERMFVSWYRYFVYSDANHAI